MNETRNELLGMDMKEEQVPDDKEFPSVHSWINSCEFPRHVLDRRDVIAKAEEIRAQLGSGLDSGFFSGAKLLWMSLSQINEAALHLRKL